MRIPLSTSAGEGAEIVQEKTKIEGTEYDIVEGLSLEIIAPEVGPIKLDLGSLVAILCELELIQFEVDKNIITCRVQPYSEHFGNSIL